MLGTILIGVVLFIGLTSLGASLESKDYNKGKCPNCGHSWRLFTHDSQGGRGYWCDECNNTAWVSYHRVDKNYKREE